MLIATLVISGLGIGLGLMLGVAARAFAVEENPLTKQVEQMMPGSQCGQCGFPGCSAAASAMVEGAAPVTCCPPGGRALAEKLASLLGVGLDAAGASWTCTSPRPSYCRRRSIRRRRSRATR